MNKQHTAVFVPSYCLDATGKNLSTLSYESVITACNYYKELGFDLIVLSAAYIETWEKEAEIKKRFLVNHGVPEENILVIGPVTSSFDEIEALRSYVRGYNIKHILMVAESYHAPRAEMILKTTFSDIKITVEKFRVSICEPTLEPHPIRLLGKIKGWRSGHRWSWFAWNKIIELLTPFMVKRLQSKVGLATKT